MSSRKIQFILILLILFTLPIMSLAQEATEEPIDPEVTSEAGLVVEGTEEPRSLPEFTGTVNGVLIPQNEMPLIGEPVEVTLLIETPLDVEIPAWPLFPVGEGSVFEILDASEVERVEGGDSVRYEQTITLIIWAPGIHLTPEIPIVYQFVGTEIDQFSPLRSASFDVPDLLPFTTDQSLRASLPPIFMNHIPTWIWIAGFIAVVAVLWFVRILWRVQLKRREHVVMTAGTPGQVAITRLTKLRTQDVDATQIYSVIAETLRVYLNKRLGISTQERTTFELMKQLRSQSYLPERYYQQLQRMLEEADLVKFAKFEPEKHAGLQLLEIAMRWIESVERVRVGNNA